MTHSFIAYIDESGDDGFANFRTPGRPGGGSSHWLVVSACIARFSNDLEMVKWRDEVCQAMPDRRGRDLHFRKLNHSQKIVACRILSEKPIRAISVLSNKTTAPEGVFTEKNQLYFYTTRYLIERISWLCRDMRPKVPEGDGRVKIVFSRRGGMSYDNFREYLIKMKEAKDGAVKIHWPVIDIDGIEAFDHSSRAALQIVDVIASAFASGLEPDMYGNCEQRYAQELRKIVYNRNGNYLSYGLKLLHKIPNERLSQDQCAIIESFS